MSQQTHDRVEHIVVDGGSTDSTLELLDASPLVRWISEPDTGQTSAINKGFTMSRGSLVGWLNADDTLAPRALEWVVEKAARRGTGFVYGDIRILTPERTYLRRAPRRLRQIHMETGSPVPQPGSFITSSAIEKVGLPEETLHLVMDQEYFLRLFDAGVRSAHVPEVLANFHIHHDSKTGSIPPHEWLKESVRAWMKNGHYVAGSVAFGRWAVRRRDATGPNPPSPPSAVVEEALSGANWVEVDQIKPRAARAGAAHESFRMQTRGPARGATLLSRDVLLTRQVRRQLIREASYRLTKGRFPTFV